MIEVPPLPIAYVRALELLKTSDPTIEQLATVADSDPSLTGAMLRAANSAISSPVKRVGTSRAAIVRLGVTDARRMVIAATLGEAFRGVGGSNVNEHEMWRHLIATGVIADILAWGELHQSEAFTAGLLHDIGRLAMASQDPRRYSQVVDLAGSGVPATEGERHVFGFTHVEWGVAVARAWGFPDNLVTAISDHHEGEQNALAWVVCQARAIAYEMGIGNGVMPSPGPGENAASNSIAELSDHGGVDAVHEQIRWWFEQAVRVAA